MWNFNRLNKRKIEACKSEGIDANNVEEYEHMGDASPLFRYGHFDLFHLIYSDIKPQPCNIGFCTNIGSQQSSQAKIVMGLLGVDLQEV
jgi:hypothetical protein